MTRHLQFQPALFGPEYRRDRFLRGRTIGDCIYSINATARGQSSSASAAARISSAVRTSPQTADTRGTLCVKDLPAIRLGAWLGSLKQRHVSQLNLTVISGFWNCDVMRKGKSRANERISVRKDHGTATPVYCKTRPVHIVPTTAFRIHCFL